MEGCKKFIPSTSSGQALTSLRIAVDASIIFVRGVLKMRVQKVFSPGFRSEMGNKLSLTND